MTRLRVASFSISIDGSGAGPDQSLGNPLGFGGTRHVASERATHVVLEKTPRA